MTDLRDALLPIWAAETVLSHTPTEDNYGRSCDERGCAICNIGDPVEFLAHLQSDPYGQFLPDDSELYDAVIEYHAPSWHRGRGNGVTQPWAPDIRDELLALGDDLARAAAALERDERDEERRSGIAFDRDEFEFEWHLPWSPEPR